MSTSRNADFLVEIGTEELPPKALRSLMQAFEQGLVGAVDDERLARGASRAYASPRRLAVVIEDLALVQADREVEQKGPPVSIAFGDDGKPTKAGLAFADKCGVAIDELERVEGKKGAWLLHRAVQPGQAAAGILPDCVQRALDGLPIPRRMRWGSREAEFVRPVHWVVMLHGKDVVPGSVLGIAADRVTRGHRFMGGGEITLANSDEYPDKLAAEGHVIADFDARRQRVREDVDAAAKAAGGTAVGDDELLDEVTALTEWPVAITGSFDAGFLELPKEVIVATLTSHQRYFPLAADNGELLPKFITVANLDSPQPDLVRDGNERVIRPRLADAKFFWDADRETGLEGRRDALGNVVYQRGLGTLADKSQRIAMLAGKVAATSGGDPLQAERAGLLCKCDLLTGMVGEFPELQGVMGRYYATADREAEAVAEAIGEQYLPRFAGDALPASAAGQALGIADRLDTLCGIFATGKKPSGNRDPFGLRRAALGMLRIIVEHRLELDLPALIDAGLELQPVDAPDDCAAELYEFVVDRLRGWYLERDHITPEMFEAVRAEQLPSLTDFDDRLAAVAGFASNDAAESLAAANKRIANILRKAGSEPSATVDSKLLQDDAEKALAGALDEARAAVAERLSARDYPAVLTRLAELRDPVDRFFDDVMVMTDDAALRANRLALLAALRAEFLKVADISRLALAKG